MAENVDLSAVRRRMREVDLLICDADGSLRRRSRSSDRRDLPEGWELMPNVRETFRALKWDRIKLGIATNQPDVASGRVTLERTRQLLTVMLDAAGVPRSRRLIEICPHKGGDCVCHKPLPGMIVRLMDRAGVTPKRTLAVGNAAIDREAARRAGVRYVDAESFFSRGSVVSVAAKRVAQIAVPVK
jgi:D-glycero-D-manno-heptose 1,7-bisphosphate phosphatase